MKQFQIAYKDDASFRNELEGIRNRCAQDPSCRLLFRIYSVEMELERTRRVCRILDEELPDAMYLGCTSHANLLGGALEKSEIILSCTVFEYASTQVKLLQYDFTEETAKDVAHALRDFCAENAWVSTVEMHATMLGMSVREFCDEMNTLRSDIQVVGGGAYNPNMDDTTTYVFSKEGGFSDRSIVFLLMGGSDFHAYSTYIAGWKPLTRQFMVTKASGATLYELDGEPAFNIYQKYLNIDKNSGSLISNTLEFPLFMDYKGVPVLRCPLGLNEDDSLTMATETPEGSAVRIAYGNPEMILSNIRHDGQAIADFQPEVIQTFSCAARRAFWGDENVSDETILINGIAPTSGFYTSGEFMRIDGAVRNFNITLVFSAMREGEPKGGEIVNIDDARLDSIESEERIPLVRRFVSFIEVITKELEESNKKLAHTSITDGLTGLYNRTEIERNIAHSLEAKGAGSLSLIMLDLDNFKRVNDTYGHAEGDLVIIALADIIRDVLRDVEGSYIGRWGGEEFMVLLRNKTRKEASALAEKIRAAFAKLSYEKAGHQTVSIGVSQARANEDTDTLCSRVDKALYMAKAGGKNQVVSLD